MRSDLDLGGVLLSPFVAYAAGALAILVILRLFFARLRIARYVANPPLAEAGLYVCILALLIVFF
jgi:cadmium resistance protein CadD (predicted permease)